MEKVQMRISIGANLGKSKGKRGCPAGVREQSRLTRKPLWQRFRRFNFKAKSCEHQEHVQAMDVRRPGAGTGQISAPRRG